MKPTKKLSLKRELLTELTSDEMQAVVGAGGAIGGGLTNTCACTATNTCACVSNPSCNISYCNAVC